MIKRPKKNENTDETKEKSPITVKYASYIYAALAICVLTVLTVSIISATNTPPQVDVSIPDVSIPSVIFDTSKPDYTVDKPVDSEQSGIDAETSEPPVVNEVKFVLPCDGEIQKGHFVTQLVFSETMQDYRTHSGIDISAEIGSPVVAYSEGVVTSITDDPLMGKTIKISHGHGLMSVYKNLSKTLPEGVSVGKSVSVGQIIGAVGDTAVIEAADNPHLHFELYLDGKPIDASKEFDAIKNS